MIVIVGGGYAGAATAWALARRGQGSRVVLLEAEAAVGLYASGRNAGLVSSLLEEDPELITMTQRGSRLLAGSLGALTRCGSVRLVSDDASAERLLLRAREREVKVEMIFTSDLAREIPLLSGAASPRALRCPTDGKVEPADLLRRYLGFAREAGARILMGARVTGLSRRGGKVAEVETTAGPIEAEWVVNAAGAWAGEVSLLAELTDLGLASYRRHLFLSKPVTGIDATWPWVWDLAHGIYYRVDRDRLTLSPCDEEPHAPAAAEASQAVAADLARRLRAALPALASIEMEESRACLRTFAPDRRYIIGPDPRLSGFFWVAGLGGTGAAAGAAAGELAADLLLGQDPTLQNAKPFDPARLIGGRRG